MPGRMIIDSSMSGGEYDDSLEIMDASMDSVSLAATGPSSSTSNTNTNTQMSATPPRRAFTDLNGRDYSFQQHQLSSSIDDTQASEKAPTALTKKYRSQELIMLSSDEDEGVKQVVMTPRKKVIQIQDDDEEEGHIEEILISDDEGGECEEGEPSYHSAQSHPSTQSSEGSNEVEFIGTTQRVMTPRHIIRSSSEESITKKVGVAVKPTTSKWGPIRRGPEIIPAGFDPNMYNRLVTNEPVKRLYGGKMTDQHQEKVQSITGDVITSMHSALASAPEDVPTPTPKGINTELMPHQKSGLTWLLWRERQSPPGGILADDMGLGKTLQMVSLVVQKKNERLAKNGLYDEAEAKIRRRAIEDKNLVPSFATLVVAPASVILQWEKEVKERTKSRLLRIAIMHGPRRETSARRLAENDLVITTYQTVSSELTEEEYAEVFAAAGAKKHYLPAEPNSILTRIAWERIILDEAHQIKNRKTLVSRCCAKLPAIYRWCLTGTPVHNELWDLYSLVRFLRVPAFSEERLWKEMIMSSLKHDRQRLNTLIKGLLLRRTKQQICPISNNPQPKAEIDLGLKERHYEDVKLPLQDMERRCYNIMFEASRQKVRSLLHNSTTNVDSDDDEKDNDEPAVVRNPFKGGAARNVSDADGQFQIFSCVLVLLLRLRQAAVHMALTKEGIDIEAFKDESDHEGSVAALNETMANMSLDPEAIRRSLEGEDGAAAAKVDGEEVERIFEEKHPSTKIIALMERVEKAIGAGDKCVIVSEWTKMLGIVEYHLRKRHIRSTEITGGVDAKNRQANINAFNDPHSPVKVMLLSLKAGGVGLNLVGGNHLFLCDPYWNPQIERQACDRIYRMGQTKEVYIYKLIAEDTIEMRVIQLQQKKLELSRMVLEGATAKGLKTLTMKDLRFLFDLDGGGGGVGRRNK